MAADYHHVTRDIRCQIYALKSIGQIALSVGRGKATISREISRSTGERGYRFKQADEKANARRSEARFLNVHQTLSSRLLLTIVKKIVYSLLQPRVRSQHVFRALTGKQLLKG